MNPRTARRILKQRSPKRWQTNYELFLRRRLAQGHTLTLNEMTALNIAQGRWLIAARRERVNEQREAAA